MPTDEGKSHPEKHEDEISEVSGGEELLYALGDALRSQASKDAIAKLIDKFAEDFPNRSKKHLHMLYWGHAITAFVVVAIGVFGYFKIVSTETCGALLGGVIGGLYYSRR